MNDDRRCTARSSQTGERCKKAAVLGGTVCENHGGAAPQVRAAAERRLAERAALRRLDQVGVRPIQNPLTALAELAEEAVALKSVLAQRVAALSEFRYEGRSGTEQLRAEVALYERAMDRAARLLRDWVQLGFDERLVRLSEEQGRQLAGVIDQVVSALLDLLVTDAGVSIDVVNRIRRERVPGVVRRAIAPLAESGG
jgi:hypothetical protein